MGKTPQTAQQIAIEYLIQAKKIIDNDYEQAMRLAELALDCVEANSEISADANLIIAVALQRRGEYPQALELALATLAIANESGNKHLIGRLHNNIGNIYFKMNQIDKALEHYKTTEQYSDIFDETEKSLLKANLGMVLHSMGEYEAAIANYTEVLGIAREANNKSLCTRSLNNIGLSYGRLEEFDKALEYFSEAKALSEEIGDILVLINSTGNLASVHAHMGNYDTAIQLSLEAISISEKNNERDLMRQGLLSLSGVYEMAEKYPEALEMRKKHQTIYQEIMSERNHKTIVELREKYETEKREQEKEMFRLRNIELAELNQKLDQLNKEKDDILGIAVHDLKNPIFTIRSSAKLISDHLPEMDKNEILDIANDIQRSSTMMLDIVSSLLDINRIDSGKLAVTLKPCNLENTIEYSYVTYVNTAAKKSITLTCTPLKKSPLFVYADELLLKQVLDNLISNAIKYSPSNTTVTIATDVTPKNTVIITIHDEGLGFSADDLTKIFGKFQRLSAQPTGGEHSTGLGLSIGKKLVELMNGTISCESEGKGKGSTFSVELELAENINMQIEE